MEIFINSYEEEGKFEDIKVGIENVKFKIDEKIPEELIDNFQELIKEYPEINRSDVKLYQSSKSKNYVFIDRYDPPLLVLSHTQFIPIAGKFCHRTNNKKDYIISKKDLDNFAIQINNKKFWFKKYTRVLKINLNKEHDISFVFDCEPNCKIITFNISHNEIKNFEFLIKIFTEKVNRRQLIVKNDDRDIITKKCEKEIQLQMNRANKILESYSYLIGTFGMNKIISDLMYKGFPFYEKFSYIQQEFSLRCKNDKIIFTYAGFNVAEYNVFTKDYKNNNIFEETVQFIKLNKKVIEYINEIHEWLDKNAKFKYEITINKDEIKILINSFEQENVVMQLKVGESFIAKYKKFEKDYENKVLEREKKKQRDFEKIPYFGTYIGMAICKIILKNERGITLSLVNKILRNLSLTYDQQQYTKFSDCDRIFNIISGDIIEDIIKSFKSKEILSSKIIKGTYGDFTVYKPTLDTEKFLNFSMNIKHRSFEEYTEVEFFEKIKEFSEKEVSEKTWEKYMEVLIEHPGIYCVYPNIVHRFVLKMSYDYRRYLETLRKLEVETCKKKYIKILIELSKK